MIRYVLGFLFSKDASQICLIEKNKDWQKGKLNGVGGKIEEIDTSDASAMIREFFEETGVKVFEWEHFCTLKKENKWEIIVFRSFNDSIFDVQTVEKEVVNYYRVSNIQNLNTISNVPWLVMMALDFDNFQSNVNYL